jgi:hypothetical protein
LKGLIVPDDAVSVVFLGPGQPEAMKAAFRRVYELAGERIAAAGYRTDTETGESTDRSWRLVFMEDVRDLTEKQRNFLHGVLFKQLAERMVFPGGKQYSLDDWKELYRQKLHPHSKDGKGNKWVMRQLPGWKKPTPQKVRVSTEDLSIKQYSEYIDAVIAHAVTTFGMEFDYEPAEREAVRYRRPSTKRPTREEPTDAQSQP